MGDELRYEVAGHVATLTIDRPAVRNALAPSTLDALLAALDRADADASVRVVVLTGAGEKIFCPGADLSGMAGADGFLAAHEGRGRYAALLAKFGAIGKPSVARVGGHVLAGGVGLVLACDLAVLADDAELGLPEADRGLFPMMVTALLQRHVGRKRALELLLCGGRLSAKDALAFGLVNRVVPRAELDGATAKLCETLASKSPAALRLGRRAFFAAEDLPLGPALEHLNGQLSLTTLTEDSAEGVAAFLEKRKPDWKGK